MSGASGCPVFRVRPWAERLFTAQPGCTAGESTRAGSSQSARGSLRPATRADSSCWATAARQRSSDGPSRVTSTPAGAEGLNGRSSFTVAERSRGASSSGASTCSETCCPGLHASVVGTKTRSPPETTTSAQRRARTRKCSLRSIRSSR